MPARISASASLPEAVAARPVLPVQAGAGQPGAVASDSLSVNLVPGGGAFFVFGAFLSVTSGCFCVD